MQRHLIARLACSRCFARYISRSTYVCVRENSPFNPEIVLCDITALGQPCANPGCIVCSRIPRYTAKCIIVGALNVNYGHLSVPLTLAYLANFSVEIAPSRIHGTVRARYEDLAENASRNKRGPLQFATSRIALRKSTCFAPARFTRSVCYALLVSPRDKCCMSRSWSCHLSHEYLQVRFARSDEITRGTRAFVHQWSHATLRAVALYLGKYEEPGGGGQVEVGR